MHKDGQIEEKDFQELRSEIDEKIFALYHHKPEIKLTEHQQ